MSELEHSCFIGGLSWSTTDKGLRDAFGKFGNVVEVRVVKDRFSGRSRGFGFVSFDDQQAVDDAIEAMNGIDLDGRAIIVEKAQPQASGRNREGNRDYDRRDSGGGRSYGGRECYQCGKPGHFARECPSGDGGRGDRYSDRDDRYSRGGSGNGRYGPDRGGDRYGGRYRDSGGSNDRYNRDRSGPYERPGGGYRS